MIEYFDDIPPYDATPEQRKNPQTGEIVTTGVFVGRGDQKRLIDPRIIWTMAELGCSTLEMAEYLQIAEQTIRYNFSEYIAKARTVLKTKLRRSQLKLALDGNAVMLIWLGKNILGQSDTPLDGGDKQPLPWFTPEPESESE